jgi:hypothetical protein
MAENEMFTMNAETVQAFKAMDEGMQYIRAVQDALATVASHILLTHQEEPDACASSRSPKAPTTSPASSPAKDLFAPATPHDAPLLRLVQGSCASSSAELPLPRRTAPSCPTLWGPDDVTCGPRGGSSAAGRFTAPSWLS